jgi:large subunit ribosomal protein L28
MPNIQSKRIWIAEEKRYIRLNITARALRTLDKKGLYGMLRDLGVM